MASLKDQLKGAPWHCEPPKWQLLDEGLTLTTGDKTDFWQDTYYGFRRDDGHFLGRAVSGDFTASLTFDAAYEVLYDQAGLMMRQDANTWLKTGIEYSDEVTNFSVVVTRDGRSDWSEIAVPRVTGMQKVRLTRQGRAVIVHHERGDGTWRLMRLADFPESADVRVGPMAWSPERAGLAARFGSLEIGPAIDNPLHAS